MLKHPVFGCFFYISMKLFASISFFIASLAVAGDPTHAIITDVSVEPRAVVIATKFDSLFSALSREKGFNGNVLVGIYGNIVYKNAFGYSDLKTKEPLNIQSVFQLASVSKQFTAIAIMMLKERGLLDYSDTVQKFIPDFPYRNITIRQLLSHRSGLPNYMYFAGKYWKNKRGYLTNEGLLEMMKLHKPSVEFLPDRRYKYSNTGYAVLASIVERISGLTFDEFMEQHIFLPLEMSSTFVYNPKNKKTVAYETSGYTKRKRKTSPDFLDGVSGDKGVYSTVEDLFKWDQALYTEKLIHQSTLEEAYTPSSYDIKRENNYGFGWRIDTLADGSKVVYHGGLWRGYNSLFLRRLDDHTTVIILCNKVNWSWGEKEDLISLIDSANN
jgi:CubicO group peptidase (beta-lactamase class C family)